MTSHLRSAAPAIAGLAWLAAFSVLYTIGDEIGAWPGLPPGAFQNLDLVAGLTGGVLLLVVLLLPPRRKLIADSGQLPLR